MSRPNGYTAPWTDAETAYIRENYGKVPVREIAATLGRTIKAVYHHAELDDATCTRPSRAWTAAEEAVIRENYGRMTSAQIGKLIGRSAFSVSHRAVRTLHLSKQEMINTCTAVKLAELRREHHTAAIPLTPQLVGREIPRTLPSGRPVSRKTAITLATVHEYFTDMVSREQAYVLGLLAADGNVGAKHPRINIGLKVDDEDVVAFVRDRLSPLAQICHTSGRAIVQITSRQMVSDLARFAIVPRKSRTLRWPADLGPLLRPFLLGCFDGDGTAFLCRGGNRTSQYPGWGICSGSRPFLAEMKEYIQEKTGVELEKIHHRPRTNLWQVATTGMGAFILDEWLHLDGFGLARKRFPERVLTRYRVSS